MLQAIGAVVAAELEQLDQLHQRYHLPAVRVAGKHQIDAGRRLRRVIARLMIQHDGEPVRVQPLRQRRHVCASGCLGGVLTADQIKAIADQRGLILQHSHAVFLERLNDLGRAVAAPPV